MADFGGFEIETPQEVLARLHEQRAQAMQSNDPVVRQEARIAAAFEGLFGPNNQVRNAEANMKAVTESVAAAMKDLPEDASDIDRARARLRASQSALETSNPAAAMQIEQQLMKLDSEEFERNRLLGRDARDEETHAARIEQHEANMRAFEEDENRKRATAGLRQVLTGPASAPRVRTFDTSTEEGRNELAQYMEDNPDAVGPLDPKDVANIMYRKPTEGPTDKIGLIELRKLSEDADAAEKALTFGTTFLEILRETPDAFATGTKWASKADAFARNVESVARAGVDFAKNKGGYGQYYDDAGNYYSVNEKLTAAGITDARLQGLAINLAYSLARALDPSGRLSDKDVEFAMKMIGGNNPNAEAIAAVMMDNVGGSADIIMGRMRRRAPNDLAESIAHMEMLYGRFYDVANSFSTRRTGAPSSDDIIDAQLDPDADRTGDNRFRATSGSRVGYR